MLPELIKTSHSMASTANSSPYDTNTAPVIGIVSQPLVDELKPDPRFEGKTSYIMQAYVHFMESAGARVVPIILEDDRAVVDDKLSKLNGILFPGGSGDYLDLGHYIYESLVDKNDAG